MLIKNNWITTNLEDRLTNKDADFVPTIVPTQFNIVDFNQAINNAIHDIKALGKKIYLTVSGGADSEFVLRKFVQYDVDFTPVTVVTNGNKYELRYAERAYKDLNLTPTYLDLSDKEYLTIYVNDIVKKLNSPAIATVPSLIVGRYALDNNGIMVTADGIVGMKNLNDGVLAATIYEWDFYWDILLEKDAALPFLWWSPQLVYSMVSLLDESSEDEYKEKVYKTLYRPVFSYHWSDVGFNRAKLSIDMLLDKNHIMYVDYKKTEIQDLLCLKL